MKHTSVRPAGTRHGPKSFTTLKPGNPFWPDLWLEMSDPPREIIVSGDPGALVRPMIGIVGTRRATARGLAVARGIAADLAGLGWTIVSGLALGIDGAAHRGALQTGGISVGVMGTGSDLTYPAAHSGLRKEMEEKGCCLTEFPPGVGPRPYHFPRRNRLLAALVRGLIVVEAPIRSGAMLTAYLALDYNREVFAVPGPVDNANSQGCHQLLREGAQLLEGAGDLTRVLGLPDGREVEDGESVPGPGPASPSVPIPGSAARWILDRLDLEGVPRDELRDRWPFNEEGWQEGMVALELAGLIRRLPGGRLARTIWQS